jgi:hypothetical protein
MDVEITTANGFTVKFFAGMKNTAMAVSALGGFEALPGEEKWLSWLLPLASSLILHSVSLSRHSAGSGELDILEHS